PQLISRNDQTGPRSILAQKLVRSFMTRSARASMRSDWGGGPRVLDSPVEGVVGDFLPPLLADREMRAIGELLVVGDRSGLALEALGCGLVDRCRHDVV